MKKIGINKIPIGIIMNLIFGGIKLWKIYLEKLKQLKRKRLLNYYNHMQ